LLSDCVIASKADSTARVAAALEMSADSATWSTSSLLFNFHAPHFSRKTPLP